MLLRSRRSVVIMLLLLMAWPSRTSWSAWKFPQRCSPHRPDPRESATSRAEPVFLLVPGTHSSIDNQLSLLSLSARRAIAMPLSYVVEAFGRTGAELRVARGAHDLIATANWSIFSFRPSPAWTHDDNGGDTRRAPSRGSAAIPAGIVVAAWHLDSPRAGWSTLGVRAHDWRRAPWRCT